MTALTPKMSDSYGSFTVYTIFAGGCDRICLGGRVKAVIQLPESNCSNGGGKFLIIGGSYFYKQEKDLWHARLRAASLLRKVTPWCL